MPLLLRGVDLKAVELQLKTGNYNTSHVSLPSGQADKSLYAAVSDRLPNCRCGAPTWEPEPDIRLDSCLECLEKNLPAQLAKSEIDHREKLMWYRIKFPEKELPKIKGQSRRPFRRAPYIGPKGDKPPSST
jgi:hypothetical protein